MDIIKHIDIHQQNIKNGYIQSDELNALIIKMETLLKYSLETKERFASNKNYGLDIIFPAIDHLKQYLNDDDMGAIALTSKTLLNLIILNFKQLQTDIYILKHHIHNKTYNYNINIDFTVHEQKLTVPIPVNVIAMKNLRKLIGQEEYFKKYTYIFFKSDVAYTRYDQKYGNFCVCPCCEKFIDSCEHIPDCENIECWGEWIEGNKSKSRQIMTMYVLPEFEYYTIQIKQKMPQVMRYTCRGQFRQSGVILPDIDTCNKCKLSYAYHKINYY